MINKQRLLNTFLELVQIDSETGHEEIIQPILKEKFKSLGLDVKEDNASNHPKLGANNLVCTLESTIEEGVAPKLYFTSHMDTVIPAINVKPIVKEDGYIYSDGTTILGADDKAGLAAIFEVLQVIQEHSLPHGQIQFVITVGEESGLVGAKQLKPQLLDADFGYAIDASADVGTTVVGAPTQMLISAKIVGKTAHASTPKEGISAINIAAKAINRMKLGQVDELTTANIGKFHGGSATNIVADEVILEAEARSHDPERIKTQVKHMTDVFENTASELGGKAIVSVEQSYPGFKINDDEAVVKIAQESARNLGLSANTIISGGGSDGSIINTFGIPSVILGVGYEKIHTSNERMPIKSLNLLASQVLEIIKIVARQSK
ncbi:tripeptidase T [Staphylococcus schweitzeri]|uniref:tripeptidase T n=1 Tax=Staphylococcus schweitzeri TaxID=1654388 RepID=UPI000507A5CB|nr:tripeptidase T [Staphylococcus schweitzeri]CDR60752.1 putative peptidase [Staphylococcus schweitzeri]